MPEWVCEGPRRQDFCCPTVLSAAYSRAPRQTSAAWPWQHGTGWRVFEYRAFQTASFNSIQTLMFPHYPHYRKGCVGLEYVDSGLAWDTTSPSLLLREACADTTGWQVFQRRCRSMWEEPVLIIFPLRHHLPSWCISYLTLPVFLPEQRWPKGQRWFLRLPPTCPQDLPNLCCRTRIRTLLEICLCWWLWISRRKIGIHCD